MSLADVRSARSSPAPDACPECDTGASVTSDLHKYQVACTCKPASAQYACADDPGPPAPVKTDTPPALPPRPPTSVLATNRRNNASVGCNGNETTCRRRKYAWWCCGCGALAAALGGLLAAQHILLRSYTASPHHLETVPAAVPAAMLVLTGFCIMSLARRRNRYSYMIKVVGAFCLVCALTCVLVTITTTVIHMNKLQTLKFCEYTRLTRTCTCYSLPPDLQHGGSDDDGARCVFEAVADCGVVHGALYWCLRGVFALSVSAVLVCIFSCMLAYQLLSHERKKMYWEQLELRCRSLYRPPGGGGGGGAGGGGGGGGAPGGRPAQTSCSCCAQCHSTQPAWDFSLQHRFWAPGRIGNLYSPNPGTGRKTSPWSWFPWPRGNSQTSRCRMGGVPQSGDSAYGFCENEQNPNPGQSYDERSYPVNFNQYPRQNPNFPPNSANFPQNPINYPPNSESFPQNVGNFSQSQYPGGTNFGQSTSFSPGFQEGFGETSGSFDAQTGVWGPPPPYSPQGRNGSRHHLHHQDPAAATLLHHHHIDHRNTIQHETLQHACSRNFIQMQNIPEINRINPESRINQDLTRLNPDLTRLNPDLTRLNPDLTRMSQDVNHIYPNDQDVNLERFNTLRGHLVPYRGCPRLGLSSGNLHRDCREDVAIECIHQTATCKDEKIETCPNLGKENLGFQNDKHSPVRSSIQDCRAVNQNTESEVYFADVSSCCNADCCVNANVSALVGTIESHPESTSESDTSFTLTRQQRPQPQVGSKRRPKIEKNMKQDKVRDYNNSVRLTEQQIEQLNNSMRIERMNEMRMSDRVHSEARCDRMSERESRVNESRDRLNDPRVERLNDPKVDRLNDSRVDRLNDSRGDRLNESRVDRLNDSRGDRLNDSRVDRLNDSRVDRLNDSRIERLNDSRVERFSDSRADRLNDSRVERLSDSRADRLNDSRVDRVNDDRSDPRGERMNESRDRLNERNERLSDRLNDSRIDRMSERERTSERIDRFDDPRMSELNSSIRIEGSPKMRHVTPLRMPRSSPKNINQHPRQSSSDSNKDFFTPNLSPLSPNTEESLLSDDDRNIKPETVYSNEPEVSKCLAPDSQYETVREKEEILKTSHHHCYSDTNTMDSGWQSGSEKQVTD